MMLPLAKMKSYKYNSLMYVELEDIHINLNEDLIIEQTEAIIICNAVQNEYKILWGECSRMYIEFVEPEFISSLEKIGFSIVSQFVDYWKAPLLEMDNHADNLVVIRNSRPEDYSKISLLTKSCEGFSRGLHGEDIEFIKEWNEEKHSCVLVAELDGAAVGVSFVNMYGFGTEKGPVLWIRELAVEPKSQNRGIGHFILRILVQSSYTSILVLYAQMKLVRLIWP